MNVQGSILEMAGGKESVLGGGITSLGFTMQAVVSLNLPLCEIVIVLIISASVVFSSVPLHPISS